MKQRRKYSNKPRNPIRQTNWYAITGGEDSGKTTTVDLLSERGFKHPLSTPTAILVQNAVSEKRLMR